MRLLVVPFNGPMLELEVPLPEAAVDNMRTWWAAPFTEDDTVTFHSDDGQVCTLRRCEIKLLAVIIPGWQP